MNISIFCPRGRENQIHSGSECEIIRNAIAETGKEDEKAIYRIRFDDGTETDAFEDELIPANKAEVETNVGTIPVVDLLHNLSVQAGFDDYEELYGRGYRIPGYKNITPKMLKPEPDVMSVTT